MTRSELIELMASQQNQLTTKDVELAVKLMIDHMAESLLQENASRFAALVASHCTTENPARVETPRPVMLLSWKQSMFLTLSPAKN